MVGNANGIGKGTGVSSEVVSADPKGGHGMKQYLVQVPNIENGKRGLKFGKWKTKFYLPTLDHANRTAEKLGTTPYRIMYDGKRVD